MSRSIILTPFWTSPKKEKNKLEKNRKKLKKEKRKMSQKLKKVIKQIYLK